MISDINPITAITMSLLHPGQGVGVMLIKTSITTQQVVMFPNGGFVVMTALIKMRLTKVFFGCELKVVFFQKRSAQTNLSRKRRKLNSDINQKFFVLVI